jgi:copper homeostasis protein
LPNILLEIVASTVEDCVAAESGGADRIELCAAIATGGLTPSLGTLIEAKKRVQIPVMVIVRPRAGGFCYSEADFAVMRRDATLLLEHGADGLVFGMLHSDGRVDTKRCGKMLELAGGRQAVFHRAFDVVADPLRELEELIDLGFTRVPTSGQQKTACDGRERIHQLMLRAGQRIEVLPGGGVRPHNVRQLFEATHCAQVHLTAFSSRCDASTSTVPLSFGSIPGAPSSSYECVDREAVRRMRETLDSVGQPAG